MSHEGAQRPTAERAAGAAEHLGLLAARAKGGQKHSQTMFPTPFVFPVQFPILHCCPTPTVSRHHVPWMAEPLLVQSLTLCIFG